MRATPQPKYATNPIKVPTCVQFVVFLGVDFNRVVLHLKASGMSFTLES